MTEHQILLSIRKNKCSIGYLELLSQNLTEDFPDPQADKARIRHLISENCISGSLKSGGRLYLEPKGVARLDQMQQELDKLNNNRASNTAENRAQKRFALISDLIVGVVGAVFTELIGPLIELIIALLT